MVQLTEELVRFLDDEAARRAVSRSAVIREVLTEHLADSAEAAITDSILEGYRRVPPLTPDAWGNLDSQGERSWAELAQRLDAEEADTGFGPW